VNEDELLDISLYLESMHEEALNKIFSVCPICRDPIYKCNKSKKCECCNQYEIRCWRCVKHDRKIGHYEN
jgi:hypothetical protein